MSADWLRHWTIYTHNGLVADSRNHPFTFLYVLMCRRLPIGIYREQDSGHTAYFSGNDLKESRTSQDVIFQSYSVRQPLMYDEKLIRSFSVGKLYRMIPQLLERVRMSSKERVAPKQILDMSGLLMNTKPQQSLG